MFERLGAVVIPMQPGQGFDLLVIAANGTHLVEVKNPAYKWELTKEESLMKIRVEQAGQKYNIIEDTAEAAVLVGHTVAEWDSELIREAIGR